MVYGFTSPAAVFSSVRAGEFPPESRGMPIVASTRNDLVVFDGGLSLGAVRSRPPMGAEETIYSLGEQRAHNGRSTPSSARIRWDQFILKNFSAGMS